MAPGAAASLPLAVFCAVTLSVVGDMIPFHEVVFLSKKDDGSCLVSRGARTIFETSLCWLE